MTNAVESVRL